MVLMTALIIDTDNGVDGITDDTIEDYGMIMEFDNDDDSRYC